MPQSGRATPAGCPRSLLRSLALLPRMRLRLPRALGTRETLRKCATRNSIGGRRPALALMRMVGDSGACFVRVALIVRACSEQWVWRFVKHVWMRIARGAWIACGCEWCVVQKISGRCEHTQNTDQHFYQIDDARELLCKLLRGLNGHCVVFSAVQHEH